MYRAPDQAPFAYLGIGHFVNTRECYVKKTYVKPEVRSRVIRPSDIEAGARFTQKRSVARYPFAAHAVIQEPLTGLELAGRTSDISVQGCYVESVDHFPRNTLIRIRIEQDGAAIETWGRVAHVKTGIGTGLAFLEVSTEERLIIENWVANISKFLYQ